MTVFRLGKLELPYELKRSETASRLHLTMTLDGLSVTAPENVDQAKIDETLHNKRRWIVENHASLREKYDQMHKIARFQTGAKVPYWGRLTRLTVKTADISNVSHSNGITIQLDGNTPMETRDDVAESQLREWMKQRLQEEAKAFAKRHAKSLDVSVTALRVGSLKSRWGSCGENGVISLDWHLVFGPKKVLSYVIAHELAHLVVRNHGDAFWRKVQAVFGEYKAEHDWLLKNEHLLGYQRIPLIMLEFQNNPIGT
jgi:predicted metal-dependent hydrolase